MPHYKLLNLRFLLLRTIHAWRTYICIYLGMRRSGAPRNILKACWNRRAWVRIWIDWLLDSSTSFRNSYAEYARNFPQVFRWSKPSYEDCDAVEQIYYACDVDNHIGPLLELHLKPSLWEEAYAHQRHVIKTKARIKSNQLGEQFHKQEKDNC